MLNKAQLSIVLKRFAFTTMIILLYVLGCQIPLPFARVTNSYIRLLTHSPMSFVSIMTGGNVQSLSLFSIGLGPIMIAMLVVQLGTLLGMFSTLSMRRIDNIQNIVTLVLAVLESYVLVISTHITNGSFQTFAAILILTTGSMFVVYLGSLNGTYGIGGMMIIIIYNILTSTVPQVARSIHYLQKTEFPWLWIGLLIIGILALIVFFIGFGRAYYPFYVINTSIPSYAKPILIPVGLNIGAMMTYMLGLALLYLPVMLGAWLGPKSIFSNIYFSASISGLISMGLFYFFSFMAFSPKQEAKSLRNNNCYFLNIRPGKPTQRYLLKRTILIFFPGAVINALLMVLGLTARTLFGKYYGLAVLPMYSVMMVFFMIGMRDQLATLLFPNKYRQLEKEEP